MLKVRILSAAVILPVAISSIIFGGWVYALLIAALSFLACAEYVQLLKIKSYMLVLPAVIALCAVWQASAIWGEGEWFTPTLAIILGLITFWELIQRHLNPEKKNPTSHWALTLAGGLYIGIGSSFLLRLRALNDGLWWTFTALPIIWVSESAAYAVGRRYGRHKMSPTISPGKSWEGYTAQVASGIFTGGVAGWGHRASPRGCGARSFWPGAGKRG